MKISNSNNIITSHFNPFIENCAAALNKVAEVAKKIFKFLKHCALFPLRFIGSKTFSIPGLLFRLPVVSFKHCLGKNDPGHSFKDDLLCNKGYHRFDHHNMNSQEAKNKLLYACACAGVHRNQHKWTQPFGYEPMPCEDFGVGLESKNAVLFDPDTGLKIVIYRNGDDVLITFGAKGSHVTQFNKDEGEKADAVKDRMIKSAAANLFGMHPALYTKADKFVKALMASDQFKGKKVSVVGQSVGGSIASYVSLRQQIPGFALNAVPLGPGLQIKIGEKNLRNADQILTHIISKGDIFADLPVIVGVVDAVASLLGLRTPANFGTKHHVPAIYKSILDNHTFLIGSMIAHAYPKDKKIQKQCRDMCADNPETRKAAQRLMSNNLGNILKA